MKTHPCFQVLLLTLTCVLPSASQAAAGGRNNLSLPPEIQSFIGDKERQARDLAVKLNIKAAPEIWDYFDTAKKGRWGTVSNLFEQLKKRSSQYEGSKDDPTVGSALWQPVVEVQLACEAYALGEPAYATACGKGIVESIPRGAIYFGGTDPGRGLVTAWSKSHEKADPFFTLTQNALADGRYLIYLREMYGSRIYVPSNEDSQKCFAEYMQDVQERMKKHQLKPGEDVKMADGKVQVSGQVAVMAINGLLAKVIFDQNPTNDFYIEESFPLDWMFPHLVPHGLIMQLRRQPLAGIPTEEVKKDREFWLRQQRQMIGEWLTPETSVKQVCEFAGRIHGRRDFSGFTGDRKFVASDSACKTYSKLRSSIGGLYTWRIDNAASQKERLAMTQEAEFAFKQAYAFCPTSPEALYRYVNILIRNGRADDAWLLAATTKQLDPKNRQLATLLEELDKIRKQQKSMTPR